MSFSGKQSESFSSVDAAWLHMDTPTNLAVITGVIIFDEGLDYERLRATIKNRLLVHRRFRQCACEPERPVGLPRWENDPDFDLNNHFKRIRLSEPGDHDALQRKVGEMMGTPLDPSKPLWQIFYVENYYPKADQTSGEGAALICRVHHCIADGLALVQILLSLADHDPGAPWPEDIVIHERELSPLASFLRPAVKAAMDLGQSWRSAQALVHEGMETFVSPSRFREAVKLGASSTMALGKLVLIGPDRRTVLRGKCGEEKRAIWSQPFSLDVVKSTGNLMGGTVNDVLLSAVTGALRRYLEARGETVEGLDIRTIVPVNLRPPEELKRMGNRFGLVFLSLPVGIRDPIDRLVVLRRRMDAIKDSPEAVVAQGVIGAMGMTPTQVENIIVSIFGMKGTAVMTNVPGPRKPLYLAGKRIRGLMFWVPTPGNLALGVSIISYAGEVVLGVATDADLIPDPEVILDGFHEELTAMSRWGRPPTRNSEENTLEDIAKIDPIPPEVIVEDQDASGRCQAITQAGRACRNRALEGSTMCYAHRNLAVPESAKD